MHELLARVDSALVPARSVFAARPADGYTSCWLTQKSVFQALRHTLAAMALRLALWCLQETTGTTCISGSCWTGTVRSSPCCTNTSISQVKVSHLCSAAAAAKGSVELAYWSAEAPVSVLILGDSVDRTAVEHVHAYCKQHELRDNMHDDFYELSYTAGHLQIVSGTSARLNRVRARVCVCVCVCARALRFELAVYHASDCASAAGVLYGAGQHEHSPRGRFWGWAARCV